MPSWKLYCDSHLCFQLYSVIDSYKRGMTNKAEAAEVIQGMYDTPEMIDSVRNTVDEILRPDMIEDEGNLLTDSEDFANERQPVEKKTWLKRLVEKL